MLGFVLPKLGRRGRICGATDSRRPSLAARLYARRCGVGL